MILHYYEKGDPKDKLVLFIHGSASDASVWLNELNIVAANGYHCVALDLRGHGETRYKAQPLEHVKLDIDTHIHDVTETLEHLGIIRTKKKSSSTPDGEEEWEILDKKHQTISIVTHSFGGIVAINIAEQYPKLVDRLCLVCLPPKLIFPMKQFLHVLLGKPLEFIQAHLDIFQATPLRSRYKSSITTDAHVLKEIYKHVKHWNSFRKLRRVHCPIHFAAARFDFVAAPWLIYKLHLSTANSSYELFKWSSHALMEDEPEKFRHWLLTCLSEMQNKTKEFDYDSLMHNSKQLTNTKQVQDGESE